MSEALIHAKRLSRHYGRRIAVNAVDFTGSRGRIVGVLGLSGAGKSTLMQMLTGNLAPSAGSVTVGGVDLLQKPRDAKAMIGYLPENPPLYRDFTVTDYLRFCGRLHGLRGQALRAATTAAQARCGLSAAGKRLIGHLSKGYQQRVGIAQAILHNPPVVILDEPTVGLDPIQMRDIRALIRQLGDQHAVIMSTHLLPEVQAVCSHVHIMREGRWVFADSLAGLTDRLSPHRLVVQLDSAPADLTPLTTLPGVLEVTGSATQLTLRHNGDAAIATRAAAAAVAAGWSLRALYPERISLEQVFVDRVMREQPSIQAAAQ